MDVDVVKFKRPKKHNALDLDHLKEIYEDFESCKNAVVIYGEPSFCSGIDLDYFKNAEEKEIEEFAELANSLILKICSYPKPVIAFVKGYAIGAGFSIALACDSIIADENAIFSTGFAKLGIAPDMGVSYLLPRVIGLKKALYLLMSAERITAEKAYELGIVQSFGELEDAIKLAKELDGNSVKYIKELVYHELKKHVEKEMSLALMSIKEIRGQHDG